MEKEKRDERRERGKMDTPLREPSEWLRAARLMHPSDEEMIAYYYKKDHSITHARIMAHLKICLICQRRENLLEEAAQAMNS